MKDLLEIVLLQNFQFLKVFMTLISFLQSTIVMKTSDIYLQGVPRELTKSIGRLHRPGSIPGPIIRGEKFTDARTF